jgi:transposase
LKTFDKRSFLPYLFSMARKAQLVQLSTDELRSLKTTIRRGTTPARVQARARILDLLHRKQHPAAIAAVLGLSTQTVFNIKRRYLAEGLDSALQERPRSGTPKRIAGAARAKITALACCSAPEGHARWTLRLLADRAVALGFVETISHNAVKEILKKTDSSRTSKGSGASGR